MQATRSAWREVVAASSVMYVPEGQLVQMGEAIEEYFPAAQLAHVVSEVAPNDSLDFPAPQPRQPVDSALA